MVVTPQNLAIFKTFKKFTKLVPNGYYKTCFQKQVQVWVLTIYNIKYIGRISISKRSLVSSTPYALMLFTSYLKYMTWDTLDKSLSELHDNNKHVLLYNK